MRNRSIQEYAEWREYQEGRGPKPDSPTSLGRHERKCTVCDHPDRDLIEQEFLRWYSPQDIARDHDLPYASAIYRHAHATGLFERRRRTVRLALEPLIEQATGVNATAGSVIRATRTYAHLDGAGQWIRPLAKAADMHRRTRRSSRVAGARASKQRRRAKRARRPSARTKTNV
jgi:hypothetical protein